MHSGGKCVFVFVALTGVVGISFEASYCITLLLDTSVHGVSGQRYEPLVLTDQVLGSLM